MTPNRKNDRNGNRQNMMQKAEIIIITTIIIMIVTIITMIIIISEVCFNVLILRRKYLFI